jgi:DinB superfamily
MSRRRRFPMNEVDRAVLTRLLNESSRALEEAVAGVPEAQAVRRSPQGGWSVAEIVEHVAVAEEQMFFALTERFRELPEPAGDPEREKRILAMTLDRAQKMTSPEVSRPAGRFESLGAGLGHFRRCRARTLAYAERTSDNLRRRSVKHPLAGVVSGYEYLLILAGHPARHAAQIRELRATLGF